MNKDLIIDKAIRGDHKVNIITQDDVYKIIILDEEKFIEIMNLCNSVLNRVNKRGDTMILIDTVHKKRIWVDVSEEEWSMILLSL